MEKGLFTSITSEALLTVNVLQGGQKVNPNSVLCRITCNDNQHFDVKACINGTIVEINAKLLDDFDLLKQKVTSQLFAGNIILTFVLWLQTWSDGYIAIILPFLGRHASEKESLLSYDQYMFLLEEELSDEPISGTA